jgi:hypothetical protein
MKIFFAGLGILIAFIVTFGLIVPSIELGYLSFWSPKFQNVQREVFEQTKSYSNGMTADLAKYYSEYQVSSSPEDKRAIKALVSVRFSNFDKSVVNEPALVQFLMECRGF